jgi:DNA-binding MarR family transcriptional regulator
MVALLLGDRVQEVSSRLEKRKKSGIPLLQIAKITDVEIRILKKIQTDGESTQRQIARDTNRKISSVSRILTDLEAKGCKAVPVVRFNRRYMGSITLEI